MSTQTQTKFDLLLPHNWRPRPYQRPLWDYLEGGGVRAAACWHRRAGKDDIALHWTAVAAHQRIGTYWHMLPEANQARKAIWNAINPKTGMRRIDEAFPREIRASTNETEMFIRFDWGSTWQVVGSDNFNSLVGSPPIGVTFSEWSLANPAALAYLMPILTENGGWVIFIYTPRGKNHGERIIRLAQGDPNWFGQILTVDDTGVIPPAALEEALREYQALYGDDAGQAFYEQEFYCSFEAAILGSVYGAWIAKARKEGRITRVPYNPQLPVYTAWDLGRRDPTTIWYFQIIHREIRVIGYHHSTGKDVPFYVELLRKQPWAGNYGKHYVPHDAAQKLLAAAGRSIIAQFRAEGYDMQLITATSQQNSIQATRQTLPHCWFDGEACSDGIDALTSYRFEWDDDKRTFADKPVHDWASHGADAFEILSRVWREENLAVKPVPPKFPIDRSINEILAARREKRLNNE